MNFLEGKGVGESQAVGMEHETRSSFWVVERVSYDRMVMVREVDADLVGATCLELAVDQAGAFESL